MKTNKKSVIVLFCIAAAMFLGGVLAIFVPKLIPSKSPVAISQEIRMVQIDYGEYSLTGKIKNVSNKEIVISGHGGLTVSFTDSNDVFDDCWFGEESRDIVLLPNEEFDLSNTAYCFEEQTSVKKVVVNVNGETYTLKGGANLPAEDLPRVFDRFFTSDQTRSGHNTGLGLAIVKVLTLQMEGEAKAEQDGGTFSVLLTWKK